MDSSESLETFLLWLGRDHVSGALKYEEIRQKLILLFRCRGCSNPEELSDETIDRTARVVIKPEFSYTGDPLAYLRGVARNVYFEWQRKQRRIRSTQFEEGHDETAAAVERGDETEALFSALERCLTGLSSAKRSLLLRYYQGDKRAKIDSRQVLADEEGIGLNALRIQVFRLRNTVRKCIEEQLRSSEMQGPGKPLYG